MAENVKFERMPIALALFPVVIQVAGITAFLYVAREQIIYTFAAIILSLIWLKVSEDKSVVDFGEKRAARHLFGKLGEWLDQKDAENVFDEAQIKYLMFDSSIESDEYSAVATASGIANTLRGAAYVVVSMYLVFVVFTVVTSA